MTEPSLLTVKKGRGQPLLSHCSLGVSMVSGTARGQCPRTVPDTLYTNQWYVSNKIHNFDMLLLCAKEYIWYA